MATQDGFASSDKELNGLQRPWTTQARTKMKTRQMTSLALSAPALTGCASTSIRVGRT